MGVMLTIKMQSEFTESSQAITGFGVSNNLLPNNSVVEYQNDNMQKTEKLNNEQQEAVNDSSVKKKSIRWEIPEDGVIE